MCDVIDLRTDEEIGISKVLLYSTVPYQVNSSSFSINVSAAPLQVLEKYVMKFHLQCLLHCDPDSATMLKRTVIEIDLSNC